MRYTFYMQSLRLSWLVYRLSVCNNVFDNIAFDHLKSGLTRVTRVKKACDARFCERRQLSPSPTVLRPDVENEGNERMTNRRRQANNGPENEPPSADLQKFVAGLVRVVDMGMAEEVEPYDLTPLDFNLLRFCMERGECTATQMAQVLPVDPARISRIVNKVVEQGLLRRRRLRSDRRVVMLTLTDEGKGLTSQIWERVQEYNNRITEGISQRDMRVFESVTQRIIDNHANL